MKQIFNLSPCTRVPTNCPNSENAFEFAPFKAEMAAEICITSTVPTESLPLCMGPQIYCSNYSTFWKSCQFLFVFVHLLYRFPGHTAFGVDTYAIGKNIKHEKHYICDFLQQNRSFLKADFTYPRTDSCIECTSQKTSAVYPFKSYVEECSTISSVNIYWANYILVGHIQNYSSIRTRSHSSCFSQVKCQSL